MSEENTQVQPENQNEEKTEREKELEQKIADLEEGNANTVEELKSIREERRQYKEELEQFKQQPTPSNPGGEADPEEVVKKVLAEREKESANQAFNNAKQSIKQKYPEFDPQTDSAGIVWDKFEKELNKFNFSGLTTKEEFEARMKEVYDFMNRNQSAPDTSQNFHQGTNQGSGSSPAVDDGTKLSSAEEKLIKEIGWTKEKYLEKKAKMPHYINGLLRNRS